MVIGVTLMKMNGDPYYSPTFARGGLAAVFACEVLQVAGSSPTLDIQVQHKNVEDTSFTMLNDFTQLTAPGVGTLQSGSIKEQVRFRYTVGGGAATAAVHFNMLNPAWRPYG